MAFRPRPEIASRSRHLRRQRRPARRAFGPAIEPMEARALLSTLWVTDPGDSGPGTLRAAILAVDADSTPDTIDFNLGGGGHQVITLASALPPITNSVTIDGTSQPGYVNNAQPITHANLPANFHPGPAWTLAQPLVEIQDPGLGISIIDVVAGNATIKGLVLGDTGSSGDVGIEIHSGGATIQGNYIGTDWTGMVAAPFNYGVAVYIGGVGTPGAVIGGTAPGQGNLISGSAQVKAGESGTCGVFVDSDDTGPVTVQGNFIGTDASGTFAVGNFGGIDAGGPVTIGGSAPGAGNLISGNTSPLGRSGSPTYGVNASSKTIIQGNMIGTDITGTVAVPNNYFGIVGGSMIGGTDPGAGNLISGTTFNSSDGNSGVGVESGGGVVEGNFIGTDITGTKAIGNFFGVTAGAGATIGGTTAAARNVIAGNQDTDVRAGNGAVVEGNFIGLDATGEAVLSLSGIQPAGSVVGGTAPGAGNVIAAGGQAVIFPINSLFEGNKIGTNKEGTAHLGGRSFFIRDDTGNTVGGTTAGAGNLISGDAILIGPSVTGNVFQGNTIDGEIGFNDGPHDNLIGGTTPGAGNTFVSSGIDMVDDISSPASTRNAILGNSFSNPVARPISLREAVAVGYTPDVGAVNDPGDADTGPNGAQNYPVITSSYAGPSSIAIGTFNSTPGDTFRIEFYASPAGGAAGQGAGLRYLGFATVTTDANGNASFTATGLGDSAVGEEIDATATVLTGANAGSTSEFSVWAGAAPLPPSSLSGVVFSDFNHDGQVDFGEAGIPGVTVNLDGTDLLGNAVHLSQPTDSAGAYVFQNLLPGSYTVTAPQVPAGYTAGVNSVGTGGGTVSDATFTVSLTAGEDAMNYNYGDQPAATGSISAGQTAGIGFWNNKNGQALIKGLNGGVGTQLGDWLAATFPHMFGSLSGSNDLAGKSNAYVASFFQSRFVVHGQKLDAQVLATALAVYVTDPPLDNTGIGTQYGFVVSGNGLATSTFSVGGDGAAFGVANNTTMTVMDILLAADAQAVNGVLYNGNTTKRNQANDIFSAINQVGGL